MIQRGQVWWFDFGEPRGSAPGFRRPVVVVSNDTYNRSTLGTVIVVAVTGNRRRAALPGNVQLPADVSGLQDDSVVNVTQVATVDRTGLEHRVGVLPQWLLEQVDDGLRRALAL